VSHCRPTGGDREPACLAAAQAEDLAPRQRQRAQPRAARVVEELAGSGEREAARPAREQRDTELTLESADVVAHCRLRAPERTSHRTQALGFTHGGEDAQVVERHASVRPLPRIVI